MDRFRKLRRVVIALIIVFIINMVLIGLMVGRFNFAVISVFFLQAVIVIYFATICFGLIRETEDNEKKATKEKDSKNHDKL